MDATSTHLAAARLTAAGRRPYYAAALFALQPLRVDDDVPATVDAVGHLVHSPHVLGESVLCTATRIIHGLEHLLRDHAARGETWVNVIGDDGWATAADCEIDDDLDDLELPEDLVTPTGIGLPTDKTAEFYADQLRRPKGDAPRTPSSAACAALRPAPVGPEETGLSPARIEQLRGEAAAAVGRHRGEVPQGVRRWAEQRGRRPSVDWRQLLAREVRSATRRCAGASDYCSRRPNRRSPHPFLLPRLRGVRVQPAVVLDTSGSMSGETLAEALHEIDGVLASIDHTEPVRVFTCDTKVCTIGAVQRAADIELAGGGGSDMRPGIEAAIAARADLVIVLTDGWVAWPDSSPRTPIIAALVGEHVENDLPEWVRAVRVGGVR